MGTPSICTFSQKNMKFAPLAIVCIFGLLVESAPQGRGKNNNRKFNQKAVELAKKNNPLNPKNTKLAKKVAKEEYDEALDRANGWCAKNRKFWKRNLRFSQKKNFRPNFFFF